MLSLEIVLLTGGASRRMGIDKATVEIAGVGLAKRMADEFARQGHPVTILGRDAIEGHAFLADASDFAGPLDALSMFAPAADLVAVFACDLPRLTGNTALKFAEAMDLGMDAVVPRLGGVLQPLCAVYRSRAWSKIPTEGKRSMMSWLDRLIVRELDEDGLQAIGIDPLMLRGFNTPEEFRDLMS